MKSTTTFILIPLFMSNFVAGCDDGEPPAEPVKIAIAADKAPALVAFRDGLDGEWQTATQKSPTSYEAEVHGPYVLTVACEDLAAGKFTTWQMARTPDDDRAVTLRCDFAAPSTHAVTGHMVQAGVVQLGGERDTSTTAGWDFELGVRSGTYDLMAKTDARIALRRGIEVTGDLEITQDIDLSQEGAALAEVAFSATNAASTETLAVSVNLDKPGQKIPFEIYQGPIAAAKVAPDVALNATDAQSVAVMATAGHESRSLKRSFRVGGTTAFALPAPLAGVTWKQADGNLEVSWTALTQPAAMIVNVTGASADGTKTQRQNLDMSPRFVEATGIASAAIDTAIAGYKAEWRIDLAREYERELVVERTASGETATNRVAETVDPTP